MRSRHSEGIYEFCLSSAPLCDINMPIAKADIRVVNGELRKDQRPEDRRRDDTSHHQDFPVQRYADQQGAVAGGSVVVQDGGARRGLEGHGSILPAFAGRAEYGLRTRSTVLLGHSYGYSSLWGRSYCSSHTGCGNPIRSSVVAAENIWGLASRTGIVTLLSCQIGRDFLARRMMCTKTPAPYFRKFGDVLRRLNAIP